MGGVFSDGSIAVWHCVTLIGVCVEGEGFKRWEGYFQMVRNMGIVCVTLVRVCVEGI